MWKQRRSPNTGLTSPNGRRAPHLAAALERYATEARTSDEKASVEVLKLALSRLIITKDKGASLARDVSHSRPHKVIETNTYDVDLGYQRSVRALRKRLSDEPPGTGTAAVSLGDARSLDGLKKMAASISS